VYIGNHLAQDKMNLIGKSNRLKSGKLIAGVIVFVLILSLLRLDLLAATYYTDFSSVEGQNQTNQIVIQPSMIMNESDDDISFLAGSLADEQFCLPGTNWQPVGETWSPTNENERSIYIDLGQNIQLSQIAFHILERTEGLELFTGTPGNWEYLATLNSKEPSGWEYCNVNTQTQFLKIEATNLTASFVNELQVFGLPSDQVVAEKSGIIPGIDNKSPEDFGWNSNDIVVNEDLVTDQVRVSIPEDLSHDFTIEVYNLNGVKLMQKKYVYNISTKVLVNITNACNNCGVYILRYYNSTGVQRTVKFAKKY